jgi:hypothetical protein
MCWSHLNAYKRKLKKYPVVSTSKDLPPRRLLDPEVSTASCEFPSTGKICHSKTPILLVQHPYSLSRRSVLEVKGYLWGCGRYSNAKALYEKVWAREPRPFRHSMSDPALVDQPRYDEGQAPHGQVFADRLKQLGTTDRWKRRAPSVVKKTSLSNVE